jgi:ABC-type nitrate/sulfonate/bicarbonate transport system substrate-binding protein
MDKMRIQAFAGLHEYVAEKNGYFLAEGLDYEIVRNIGREQTAAEAPVAPLTEQQRSATPERMVPQVMRGAFEGLEAGRACDVSMACHWAVNMASSADHGRMWGHAYMLTYAAIMVPPESPIRKPEDLRSVEIGVGYHSGSHFSCLQYLEPFIAPRDVKLSFIGGPSDRTGIMYDRKIPAANMWGTEKDILEQLAFRKIVDTTYMQGFLIQGDADMDDLEKYFNALKRSQIEIDAHAEKYKDYFERLVPERFKDMVDVRAFSSGRRIVFEEYTQDVYESTHKWMEDIQIFPDGQLGHKDYAEAVLV